MEERTHHDTVTMEDLTRALFGIGGIRRDLRRRVGIDHVPGGTPALGAIKRIGPARVSDVAVELQVDLSVASRQVQALEAEGYVDRAPDPADRRSSVVCLSAAGEAKLRLVHERVIDALNEALATWSPEEIQTLVDGLLRLRAALADPTERASEEQSA
jgi:DNA-binding MarR family transcriptional regulator